MEVQINMLAVLLAAASSLAVGAVWYSSSMFGGTWSKLTGLNEKKQKKGAPQAILVATIAAVMTAYTLAHITFFVNNFFSTQYEYWMMDALQTAFWLWLGVAATTLIVNNAFEQRPVRLTALAVGYQFISLIFMGLIIGLFTP